MVLERPDFKRGGFNALLQQYNKPIRTKLPIASVPLHLHNLFEEAVAEVDLNLKKE